MPIAWPAWAVMWSLALAIYVVCKWLTWSRSRVAAPKWRQAAYLLVWPGMDADAFLSPPSKSRRVESAERLFASGKLFFGIALTWVVVPRIPVDYPLLRGWVGMAGLIFVLHFGAFHLLSCFWRSRGFEAKPLMNWPILARSLAEFWGRRWNTAFRDLTHRFLFAPLTGRFGPRGGLALGFIASGLIHDAVISIPAGGGYGWPTLYFIVQGLGLLVERARRARLVRGRLFTFAVIAAPAYGLFHPPFIERVVLPFLNAI